MKQDIQSILFQIIKEKLIGEEALGHALSDILSISPDAVYRRYRGETALTINEVKKLCSHFNVSFDALCEMGEGKVIFTYPPLDTYDFSMESYLEGILLGFQRLKSLGGPEMILSINNLSMFQLMNFPHLVRFKLFFWAKTHLQIPGLKEDLFEHEKTKESTFQIGKEILQIYNAIPSKEIYDLEFMRGFLRQIEYYFNAHLFKEPEYAIFLYDRVLMLSAHLKEQATVGKKFMYGTQAPAQGHEFEMYLNETINSDATFYFKGKETEGLYITHNVMNYLETNNTLYIQDTIQILDRQLSNSSLISIVNEKERNNFFYDFDRTINSFKKRIEANLGV
jgi:hypothetical protein